MSRKEEKEGQFVRLVIYIFLHSLGLHEHEADCEGRFTRFSVERRLITNCTEIRSHQIRAQIFHFITTGLLPKLPPVARFARSVQLARLGPTLRGCGYPQTRLLRQVYVVLYRGLRINLLEPELFF